MNIGKCRDRIDTLDRELLRIFNERAALAVGIGHAKREMGLPIYDPEREKEIFRRIQAENPGPLEDEAIVRLFERVIDESRRLERLHAKGAS